MYICIFMYIQTNLYTYMYIYMNIYAYIHISIYIHVYNIHIYIHILAWHLNDFMHRSQPISRSFLQKRHTIPKSGRFNRRPQTHSNTLQHTATHCNTLQSSLSKRLQTLTYTMARFQKNSNSLQHTATHCNTLQHTATYVRAPFQKTNRVYTQQG